MMTHTVPAEKVSAGDALVFLGREHLIAVVEPYTHPTIDGAFAIARSSDGWGMSLWHGQYVETVEVAT